MLTGSSDIAYTISVWVLPVLLAITLHEAAHGFVAWRLGDDTAYSRGRVSFNPFRHIDTFGTVLLPALLILLRAPFVFGWAKPVPVNFRRLRHPRRDMILVAAAGPGANLALATAAALLFNLVHLFPPTAGQWLADNFANAIIINLVLAVFNLFPLPPLDGGRIAVGLLPPALAKPVARLERFGLFIIVGIIFLLPMVGKQLGQDWNLFYWIVGKPVMWLMPIFVTLSDLSGGGLP